MTTTTALSTRAKTWIYASTLEDNEIDTVLTWLESQPKITERLNNFWASETQDQGVPLLIANERNSQVIVVFSSPTQTPPEPGEPGSVLSYVRAYGLGESFLYSDCYGQLSCSSCAVEILQGKPLNATPREEEYDMLDIDDQKPPTPFTRLGCQVVVGEEPLVIKVRA